VPREVGLGALYQERIVRLLATDPALARATNVAHEDVVARRNILRLTGPYRPGTRIRVVTPPAPAALRGWYAEAQRRFGVPWNVLAAVNFVETRFGAVRNDSTAGAQGPMQFLPSTWDAYGLGGDIHDPHDAVLGAANYLDASGAPEDYRRALYAYNPVDAYVTAVWSYAKVMMRDPNAYYAFYNWQVFVRTTHGDVRLSGPGFPV
jgi:hypothetical protein